MTTITLQIPELQALLELAATKAVERVQRPMLDVHDMQTRYKLKSRTTVYEWVKAGKLPAPNTSGLWSRKRLEDLGL